MNLFVITPYKSDILYEKKKTIVTNLSISKGINTYYYTSYNNISDSKIDTKLYKNSDFFIADLSYERPSCYFEIGYVQALNKPIFLIAKKFTVIHQLENKESIRLYDDLLSYSKLIDSILTYALKNYK